MGRTATRKRKVATPVRYREREEIIPTGKNLNNYKDAKSASVVKNKEKDDNLQGKQSSWLQKLKSQSQKEMLAIKIVLGHQRRSESEPTQLVMARILILCMVAFL